MKKTGVCHIQLTDKHLVKLAKGGGIFVKKEMMCGKDAPVHMAESKLRKMMTNHGKGMKYTLKLTPDELKENQVEMEGGKIHWKKLGRAVWGGIKKAAEVTAKAYREHVRPHISEGLKTAVSKGIENLAVGGVDAALTLVGAPELAAIAQNEIRDNVKHYISAPATEAIRKSTGAFGMKPKPKPKGKGKKTKSLKQEIHDMEYPQQPHPKYQLKTDSSQLLAYNHPGMSPHYPLPDHSIILVGGQGLYLHGKGIFMGGAMYPYGTPLNPAHLQLNNQAWSYA